MAGALLSASAVVADSDEHIDGHFSSWDEVPTLIESITEKAYRQQLEKLHALTRIKLGYPQSSVCLNEKEHRLYMLDTKQAWLDWWKTTGGPISKEKAKGARIDQEAFRMAWDFLGSNEKEPKSILPVWIPSSWTLYLTFSNGDYGGRETEVWVLDRRADLARLTKLRGDFSKGEWGVILYRYDGVSLDRADRMFKALCYVNRYAPATITKKKDGVLGRLYYPHSTLRLRDGNNRILWNTEGYVFGKARPEYGDGDSGRSYHFMRSVFANKTKWNRITEEVGDSLSPYRAYLTMGKPYFLKNSSDVIKLFGQQGGAKEKSAMLAWAEKQKAATDPNVHWKVCSDVFGTGSRVNVRSFTRLALEETLEELKRFDLRLEKKSVNSVEVKKLERYVADMQATEKREEEAEIQSFPQPLRDLIKADRHPDDPNLSILSAAVQKIRNKPDPKLFKQLIRELDDDGTVEMRSLFRHVLINEHDFPDVQPWGKKEEAIAINACIDALPLAKSGIDNLVADLLYVYGGGEIEIKRENSSRSIKVTLKKNGYSRSFGGASNPLSMKDAQKELRRLYKESKE